MNVNDLLMERADRERKNKERKQRKGEVSHRSTCLQEDSHDVSCDLISCTKFTSRRNIYLIGICTIG